MGFQARAFFRYSPSLMISMSIVYNAGRFEAPIGVWDEIYTGAIEQIKAFQYISPQFNKGEKL